MRRSNIASKALKSDSAANPPTLGRRKSIDLTNTPTQWPDAEKADRTSLEIFRPSSAPVESESKTQQFIRQATQLSEGYQKPKQSTLKRGSPQKILSDFMLYVTSSSLNMQKADPNSLFSKRHPQVIAQKLVDDYESKLKPLIEKDEALAATPEVAAIKEIVESARAIASGVVSGTKSTMHPEAYLMENVETFSSPGRQVCGFRCETVPKSDLSQIDGPHCDDMGSFQVFEDGTCTIAVTDGEGGRIASDSFSYFVNSHLQEGFLLVRPGIQEALKSGNVDQAKELATRALGWAFERGKADHDIHVADRPTDREKHGATTVAGVMTIPDPQDENSVWVIGVNVFDSPVILISPDGENVEVHQSHVNTNLDTEFSDWKTYLTHATSPKNPNKRPDVFVTRVPADTIVVVMSDGVTDNLPLSVNGVEDREGANREIAAGIRSIVRNPYFSSRPDVPPEPGLNSRQLESLGSEHRQRGTPSLSPETITRHLRVFSQWRTDPVRTLLDTQGAALSAIEAANYNSRPNLAGLVRDDSGEAFWILPRDRVQADLSPQPITEQAYAQLSNHEKFRQPLPSPSSLVMVKESTIRDLQERVISERKHLGGKPDGVTCIAARARVAP